MEQYIPKSALVAEIENLVNTYKKCPTRNSYEEGLKDGRLIGYEDALHKINTFELKEVDLEKLIDDYMLPITAQDVKEEPFTQLEKCSKHFFELGLKVTQKGE